MPMLICAWALFMVLMPVSTAAVPDVSIFNINYTHNQLKWRFWSNSMLYPVQACAILYGLALGIRSFSFVLVKCQTTTFLSLPLARSALFVTRMAACLLALIAGAGIPLAVSLMLNIAALGIWPGLFGDCAFVFAGLVLTGALTCVIGVFCCMLAGTIVEACIFSIVVLTLVSTGTWSLNVLMDYLLVGNAFGERLYGGMSIVAPGLVDVTALFNPLLFFVAQASAHSWFMVQHPVYYPAGGDWGLLGVWMIVLLGIGCLSVFFLLRRKGEHAGVAGLCLPMTFIVGLVMGLVAFGAVFTLFAHVNTLAACAIAFATFVVISMVLFRGLLKGRLQYRMMFAAIGTEAVCIGAIVAVVATGGLGYSSYIPAKNEVASVGVSYSGTPDYLAAKFDSAMANAGLFYYSVTYTLDDEQSIGIVTDVHKKLVQTGHARFNTDGCHVSETVVPYDMRIVYTMCDGSQVVRYFDRATYSELYDLTALDESPSVKNLERASICGDMSGLSDEQATALKYANARQTYANGSLYVSDPLYANPIELSCSAESRKELLAALALDAANQTREDRYHPTGMARGVVMFAQSGDRDAQNFAYAISNNVIYISDQHAQTLAWLERNGLLGHLTSDASAIKSLTFQRFDSYFVSNAAKSPRSILFKGYRMSSNTRFIVPQHSDVMYSTSDADALAQMIPLLRNTYCMDGGGYLVCATVRGVGGSSAGSADEYAYFFLPQADAPDWLVNAVG
ncbi:MAG: hypothetical protein LKF61_02340 [Eggerthellaceae bacterium]|nr:hypothetical protein [Eggerthellaceae bacterium]